MVDGGGADTTGAGFGASPIAVDTEVGVREVGGDCGDADTAGAGVVGRDVTTGCCRGAGMGAGAELADVGFGGDIRNTCPT